MAFPFAAVAAQAIPAAIGAGMQLFGKKRSAQTTQLPRFSSQQQSILNQLLPLISQQIQQPTEGFEPIASQARQDLMSRTLPQIANRFGGLGALGSSGYQSALTGAASGLEGSLASQKAQYGLQNRGALAQLLRLGLMPQFENIYQPESPSGTQMMGSSLLGQGLGGLTSVLGQYFTNRPLEQKLSQAIDAFKKAQGGQ